MNNAIIKWTPPLNVGVDTRRKENTKQKSGREEKETLTKNWDDMVGVDTRRKEAQQQTGANIVGVDTRRQQNTTTKNLGANIEGAVST